MPRAPVAFWVAGLVLGLGLVATAARVRSTKGHFRAEATVVFEHGVLQEEPDSPRQIGQRLREMLTSGPRLQRLIDEMHLAPTALDPAGAGAAVAEMRAALRVTVGDGTNFGVSYDADDDDRAQAVLRRLVSGVVDDDTQRRQHDAETARQSLDRERRQAEEDVRAKEARLATFTTGHPHLAAGNPATRPDRDLAADNAVEVASLELRSAELEAMLAEASGRSRSARSAAGAPHTADPAIVAARARIAADLSMAERDLDDKQTHLPYQHPDVKVALRRVAEARAALRKADAAVAASAAASPSPPVAGKASGNERVASSQRALAAVKARIESLEAQSAASLPRPHPAKIAELPEEGASDSPLARLQREVSEARERRRQLEAKLFQAQLLSTLGAAGQGGGLVFPERSVQSSRAIAGRRTKVALAGASISALLGLLTLLVAGRLDGHIYDADDVTRVLGADVVVVVPKLGFKLLGRPPRKATDTGA